LRSLSATLYPIEPGEKLARVRHQTVTIASLKITTVRKKKLIRKKVNGSST